MVSPPKCRAFIVICCIMLTNHNTTSLKGLRACKEALNTLIQETAGLAAEFDILKTAAADNGIDIDGSALEECSQMLSVMNRLMCHQLSDLKHRQMMRLSEEVASRSIAKYKFIG